VHHPHDIMTVQEIFGREDYRCGQDLSVAVDIGSNIGISALYLLSRNSTSRCYLYEPVPVNVDRMRSNLSGYEDRYEIQEVAVAARSGTVEFTVETSGRYGGIGVAGDDHIAVECRHISDVLTEVLDRESSIDMLKIDTEGAELETIRAIPYEQLARIKTICFETSQPLNPAPGLFGMTFATQTCRLEQRPLALPADASTSARTGHADETARS
jgi:FkbM family methyltransferase